MKQQRLQKFLIPVVIVVTLAACSSPTPTLTPTSAPTSAPIAEPTTAPAVEPETDVEADDLPASVEYDLGDTTIVQSSFPEDSRFHNMPVRLSGIIAAPSGEGGPYPVVVIFHGTHPGCPVDEGGVDRWPCAPEVEQPNYQGFDYLVRHLATQGYVALSININAENTFGFGEPLPGERLAQLVDLHLSALAAAAAGGPNDFGVELDGRADLRRLAFFGHSRGGEGVVWLAHEQDLVSPDAFTRQGYGPVVGLLLIAPAPIFVKPAGSSVPLAVILPACDGDVLFQEGQLFYEGARLNTEQNQPVSSVWLERANHNFFNEILGPDAMGNEGRPDCETLLEAAAQRNFLADYATDFLTAIFSDDPQAIGEATARLGLDLLAHAPDVLYGQAARVSTLTPISNRQTLLIPATVGELATNLMGGDVTADGVTTFFCEAGYYTPQMKPGSEPCQRVNLTIPGHPAMAVVSWEQSGGALRFTLPEGVGDLSNYTAISLRVAVDPLSSLNATDEHQLFSVQLTDSTGATATVQTRPAEPALSFSAGLVEENSFFEGDQFTGRVPMTTIRLLLDDFAEIDLTHIVEIALLFDQTPSGSLFIGDLEWVRPSKAR